MDSTRLFSQVILCPQVPEQLLDAVGILKGTRTVSQVAAKYDQDELDLFEGDADVLILSYTNQFDYKGPASPPVPNDEAERAKAAAILGDPINKIFCDHIIPSLENSPVSLELVVRYCNLSTDTIIHLATAIRSNKHLVGFNIYGNPGNSDIGRVVLNYACIQTRAPIQWYQGTVLEYELAEMRRCYQGSNRPHGNSLWDMDLPESCFRSERAESDDTEATSLTARSSPIDVVQRPGSRTSPRQSPIKINRYRRSATEPVLKVPQPPAHHNNNNTTMTKVEGKPQNATWKGQLLGVRFDN